mmetsp:Transcript_38/g.104  ORF Transcript_38/g.104 Transcript_38/m.104 type:complete len:276 (+) Transcript_38:737-1564(+)
MAYNNSSPPSKCADEAGTTTAGTRSSLQIGPSEMTYSRHCFFAYQSSMRPSHRTLYLAKPPSGKAPAPSSTIPYIVPYSNQRRRHFWPILTEVERSTSSEEVGSSGAWASLLESTQSLLETQTTSPSRDDHVSTGHSLRNSSRQCSRKLPFSKGGSCGTDRATRSSTILFTAALEGGALSHSSNFSFIVSWSRHKSFNEGEKAKSSKPSNLSLTSSARNKILLLKSGGIANESLPLETAPAAAANTSRFSRPSSPCAPSGILVTTRAPFTKSSTA